ncbi:hypothetical protein [Fibrivirga algicola]|uniref:Uncharacterized protein n=1 Tax=Fibrivirga algicola TaxID=2950420 RepID=A0ABX0QS91_9BACT|nr:hypothetical protein [Fibrivirga algicola]NID13757.1 hypothetical protein [Fibrivirga algicola]
MNTNTVLNPKRQAFADAQQELIQLTQLGPVGSPLDATVVEEVVNKAVELIESLEVAAALPKNVYGPRYETTNQQYNQPGGDFIQQQVIGPRSVQHHTTEINVPTERFYRLSTNLIISTSGQFAFRPETRQLHLAVGLFDLSETEALRLEAFLHNDYNS